MLAKLTANAARTASQGVARRQTRNMSMFNTFMKDATRDETWPFLGEHRLLALASPMPLSAALAA